MSIRPEQPSDSSAIREVIERSFGRPAEANLVAALRGIPGFDPALSLIAELNGRIVGHILFSPIAIESALQSRPAMALAPVCVLPEYQGCGIGSGLILHGLRLCKLRGHGVVVVLGEPGYYGRFGFQRASLFGVRAPFVCPDDAFMLVEFQDDALHGVSGTVRYPKPFEEV